MEPPDAPESSDSESEQEHGYRLTGLAGMLGFLGGDGGGGMNEGGGGGGGGSSAAAGGPGGGGKKRQRGEGGAGLQRERSKEGGGAPTSKRVAFRGAGGVVSGVPADPTSVFVHGIPFAMVSGEELGAVFAGVVGGVKECRVALDPQGKGRGFGYVCFATEEGAAAALAAQEQEGGEKWRVGGREMRLEVCRKELVDRFHAPPKPKKTIFGSSLDLRPRNVPKGGGGGGGKKGGPPPPPPSSAAME